MRIPPILTIRRIAKMSDQYYELDVAAFAGELLSRWRILVGLLLFALALSAIYLAIGGRGELKVSKLPKV